MGQCWEEMRGRTPRCSCEEIWTYGLNGKRNNFTQVSSKCAQNVNSLDDAAQPVMSLVGSYIRFHIEVFGGHVLTLIFSSCRARSMFDSVSLGKDLHLYRNKRASSPPTLLGERRCYLCACTQN